jgi:hypothetical protein
MPASYIANSPQSATLTTPPSLSQPQRAPREPPAESHRNHAEPPGPLHRATQSHTRPFRATTEPQSHTTPLWHAAKLLPRLLPASRPPCWRLPCQISQQACSSLMLLRSGSCCPDRPWWLHWRFFGPIVTSDGDGRRYRILYSSTTMIEAD